MMHLDEAVWTFLTVLKVEGRADATLSCYRGKLSGFLWYAGYAEWPNDIRQVTTARIREFLAYLRDTDVRFGGRCATARRPCNNTTRQNYFHVLSSMFAWLREEELIEEDPTARIRTPKAERKVIHALTALQVTQLLAAIDTDRFEGVRNRAITLILVDCGRRLGELLGLTLEDVDLEERTLAVDGKSGERIVGFGSLTLGALEEYLAARKAVHPHDKRTLGDATHRNAAEGLFA